MPAQSTLRRNWLTLTILFIAGELIYTLPYFRSYYYDTFIAAFHIDNTQMGALGSAFGTCALISYIFAGYVADRFKTRYLLLFSLVATGLLGFLLLAHPPYVMLLLIWGAWGFVSILTFWVAVIKAVRSLATDTEQGKAFGFFEGGRGVTNVIQAAVVLGIFTLVAKYAGDQMALSTVIAFYSALCIVLGFVVFLLYNDKHIVRSEPAVAAPAGFDWVELKRVLKLPTTWLAAILILTSYSTIISFYYITPYSTAAFGTSTVAAAALGYFSQYCRPLGNIGSGFIGDRIGVSKAVIIGYLVLILGLTLLVITPGKPSLIWSLLLYAAIIYIAMYALQATHFAILVEGDYPVRKTGTVAIPMMVIGYSAEVFMPIIAGWCLDHWPGIHGYKVLFSILLTLAVVGFITVLVWQPLTRVRRNQVKLERGLARAG